MKCFVTKELMRWPGITEIYGSTLRKTDVFGSDQDERWQDLHTRVIEHVSYSTETSLAHPKDFT